MAEVIKTVVDVELNTGKFSSELKALQQQVNAFNLTLNRSAKAQGQASKIWADDLSKLINRSGYFKAELSKIQTSAAALDSTLKKGQSTLGQFFSAAFNKRSAMAAEVFALAAERARTMQTQFIATGKAAKGMQEVLAIRPLTAYSSEISVASQRMQILSSMFKQGTTQLINFGKNVQWAGRQLMVGFTVPITIFGTTAGRVFRELEMQVVAFKKVYGDLFTTPTELNQNLEAVKGLAAEYTKYGIAVKDTVALAAQAAAAGRRNKDLTDAVSQATRLATLGQMDQNQALDTTIALQSAFRLSGKDLADTINFLNMVENQTVVSLQDLAAAIPRVAPVIQGLGGDVKDMAVFLAAMQEGGVSAEQGANALKSGLASLINPTKQAKEMLAGFNINLDAIVQRNRGDLMGTVTDFANALQTLDEFSRQQALEQIFGKFQYARLGALFENIVRDGSQASQVLSTMGYTSEQLAATAEKELGAIEQSFAVQLTAAIEKFKLSIAPIGELFVKMAIPIINMITRLANWFNSLPDGVKNIAAIATAITGLVVPAGTMMFGLFMNLVGTLAKMSQGAAIFGATLLRRGPIAALQTLTQSSKYLSLAEIDAANAAQQLGSATQYANEAILSQSTTLNSSRVAIDSYTSALRLMIAAQREAAMVQPSAFTAAGTAAKIAGKKGNIKKFNKGSIVPGTGNTDTVPAMLTPGEFVVNKESTKNNLGLLNAINMNKGGGVARIGKMFYGTPPMGLNVKEESLNPILTRGLGVGKESGAKVSIPEKIQESMRNLVFSGGSKNPVEQRKAYVAYSEAMRLLASYPDLQEDLHKEIVRRKKPNGKINVQAVKKAWSAIASKGRVDTLPLVDRFGNNINVPASSLNLDDLIGFTEKTHIGSNLKVLEYDLPLTNGRVIPAGTPVQFLNNKTLDIQDSLNKKLSKNGVTKLELLNSFKNNRQRLFSTLNDQFDTYLNNLPSDVTDESKSLLRQEFSKTKDSIFKTYIDELNDMADDAIITDRGQKGTVKLESISAKAFQNLEKSKSKELQKFNKLISYEQNVRLAPADYVAEVAKQQGLSTKGSNLNVLTRVLEKRYGEGSKVVKEFLEATTATGPKGRKIDYKTMLKQNIDDLDEILRRILPQIVYSRTGLKFLNQGNIVPGTGNTDTVPAMLTPGEFVVNKEATRNNIGLLRAINNSGRRFNKGGKVSGVQYLVEGDVVQQAKLVSDLKSKNPQLTTPQALSLIAQQGGKGGGLNTVLAYAAKQIAGFAAGIASFGYFNQLGGSITALIGSMAATSLAMKTVSVGFKLISKQPVKFADEFKWTAKALTALRIPLSLASAGWASLAIGAVALGLTIKKQREQMINASAKMIDAMYGSADTISGLASVFGTKTATQRLAESRIQKASGGTTEEAQQFATQYLESDPGKELLNKIQELKKAGGDVAEAIKNQLVSGVVSGVITTDQAKAIAGDIGLALKDQQVAIDATAKISQLLGPNGELLNNNFLKIVADITPRLNTQELLAQAEKDYENSGFLAKIFGDKNNMIAQSALKGLKEQSVNTNAVIAESIASLIFQYENDLISYADYKNKRDALGKEIIDNNQQTVDSFSELTGIKKEDINDLYNFVPAKGTQGTQKGVQAGQVKEFFNSQLNAAREALVDPLGKDLTNQVINAIVNGVNDGDIIGAQDTLNKVLTGDLDSSMIEKIASFLSSQGLDEAAREFRNKFSISIPEASSYYAKKAADSLVKDQQDIDTTTIDTTEEDPFTRIMKETQATKQYAAAVGQLVKNGLEPENVALLKQEDLLKMTNAQRIQIIKKLKEQQDTTKVLEYFMLSAEEKTIKKMNEKMKVIDREISLNQRRIDDIEKLNQVEEDRISNLERQNELDQRNIALRNRALDEVGRKEDQVNEVYNTRFETLDKVAQVNDRIQQQREGQIALASALTSGDFGAAATAASQLTTSFAGAQLEDTRTALEEQRDRELASITAEINGQLFTRQQLEDQIDQIGERVYQRNLLIQQQEDIIFAREQQIKPFKEAINALEAQRITLARQVEDAEYNKWKTELDGVNALIKAYNNLYTAKRTGKGSTVGAPGKSSSAKVETKAFGGLIKYTSNEPPPRMAYGSIVPGLGNTDKVPALLTPGEFVVRKSAASANMSLLNAINDNVFPKEFGISPSIAPVQGQNSSISNISSPVYNYSVNVNVADTNASPNEIADVVMNKIRMHQNTKIRGNRF